MQKVFSSNQQVAHVWAQQSQSDVSFTGTKTIYSHGDHFPMATFLDFGTVLVNSDTYSVSMSKQQGYVRSAINHKASIYVPTAIMKCVVDHRSSKAFFKKEVTKLVKIYLAGVIEQQAIIASKRRKKTLVESDINTAVYKYEQCNKMLEFFKIKMPVATTRLMDSLINNHKVVIAKFAKQTKREQLKRERLAAQRERERQIIAQDAVIAWKSGHFLTITQENALRNIKTLYMRQGINGEIMTSHGARFPVKDATKAFEHVLFCRENKEVWQANGQNIKLGHFNVDQIDTHGNVRAGCHYIEYAEIERNAKLLGWV